MNGFVFVIFILFLLVGLCDNLCFCFCSFFNNFFLLKDGKTALHVFLAIEKNSIWRNGNTVSPLKFGLYFVSQNNFTEKAEVDYLDSSSDDGFRNRGKKFLGKRLKEKICVSNVCNLVTRRKTVLNARLPKMVVFCYQRKEPVLMPVLHLQWKKTRCIDNF